MIFFLRILKLCSMMGDNKQTKLMIVNLNMNEYNRQTKVALDNYVPTLTQTYTTSESFNVQKFLEIFQPDGIHQSDISNINQFSQKISFWGKGQFGQKICNLIHMMYFLRNSLNGCRIVVYHNQTKAMLIHFSKNVHFGERETQVQFNPKLRNRVFHDFVHYDFFEILQYFIIQQVDSSISEFSKKLSFEVNRQFGTNLVQNFGNLYLIISSKELHEILQDYGTQEVDKNDFSQFSKKSSFQANG